jgi:hypothetical protein
MKVLRLYLADVLRLNWLERISFRNGCKNVVFEWMCFDIIAEI